MSEKEKNTDIVDKDMFIEAIKEKVKDVSEEERRARFGEFRDLIFGTSEEEISNE